MAELFAKCLVAGVGPIPPEHPAKLYAPGLRIWGMARELSRAGHDVRLVLVDFAAPGGKQNLRAYTLDPGFEMSAEELKYAYLHPTAEPLTFPAEGGLPALLAAEARRLGAHLAIGSTDRMNHALTMADLNLPLWLDYFGDPMAERQLLALNAESDLGLADQWALLAPALAQADRLSGCSRQQVGAILGQLAAVGRLNRHTVHDMLVRHIPPWIDASEDAAGPAAGGEPLLRGKGVPQDAIVILQTGGFNTWLDVHTLFPAVEIAMATHPRIHFACTGGAIEGHHNANYEWFEAAVKNSPHRERYHLLGWVPTANVPRIIRECDIGLNVDLPCIEGLLGTRNRLLDWLHGGLTVVSTPGCELAEELAENGYLTLVAHSQPVEIAQILNVLAGDREGLKEESARYSRGVLKLYSPERSLKPLLDWARYPKRASDLLTWEKDRDRPSVLWVRSIQDDEILADAQYREKRLEWLERKLNRLTGSRVVRQAMKISGNDTDTDDPPPLAP